MVEFKKSKRHLRARTEADAPQSSDAIAPPQPSTETKRARIRRLLLTKKSAIILGTLAIVIIAGLLIRQYTSSGHPDYRTVLPGDKSIDELGGWKRISPPEKDPVFAYADEINDIPISVSQQPLPDAFKTETANHVAELAKSYNATTKIDAGETTVYIGTSAKGPQSVIFTKKNLLILIKSQKTIDNSAWDEYVKSLDGAGSDRIPKY